jgi:hypothetical protein
MNMKDASFQHRPEVADAQFADRLTHILGQRPARQPSETSTLDKFGLAVIVLAVLVLIYL